MKSNVLSALLGGLGSTVLSHISVGSSSPSSLFSMSSLSSNTGGSSLSGDTLGTGVVILTLGEVTGMTTSDDEGGSVDGVTALLLCLRLDFFFYVFSFSSSSQQRTRCWIHLHQMKSRTRRKRMTHWNPVFSCVSYFFSIFVCSYGRS